MAIRILAVTLTPQSTTVGHAVSVSVEVSDNDWNEIKRDNANWQAVKTSLASWSAVKSY